MNDVLYTGNIPKSFHYAKFYDDYIDLYESQNVSGSVAFYRIYLYENSFQSELLSGTYSQTMTCTDVQVTDDWHYRRDLPSICFLGLIEILVITIIFNIVSSVFKKGGLLSGLL